jgi:hypothetical protein
MRKLRSKGIMSILLTALMLCALLVPTVPVLASPDTSMSISPATQTVDADDSFDVDVVVDTTGLTRAAQFDLSFDPSLVQIDSVTEGSYYSDWITDPQNEQTYFVAGTIDNEAGTLTMAAVSILSQNPGGQTGSGTFITVHMTAKEEVSGTSDLILSGVLVFDENMDQIGDVVSNDGEVVVSESVTPDNSCSLTAEILPAVSINIDPTSLDFGELVAGDVSDPQTITITNLGGKSVDVTAEVTGDSLYVSDDGLWLDGAIWSAYLATIPKDGGTTTDAALHVGEEYAGLGTKDGMIVFWAEVTP